MTHRFAALTATAALGLALVGTSTAWAAESPVIGTPACTAAVAADGAVQSAFSTLNTAQSFLTALPATAPLEDRVAATDGVTAADKALTDAQAEAMDRLCVADETPAPTTTLPPTTEPTTTEPTPAPSTTPTDDPAVVAVARVRALIGAIECGPDFNAQVGAVQDATFDALPVLSSEQQGALADEFNARLRAVNFCVITSVPPTTAPTTVPPTSTTEINGDVIVNPTDDDGSVADTSGRQVTEVPAGSAQTGAL